MNILFDKFEIIECIKKDIHSSVYIARHIYLGKKIVLKVLEISPEQESEALERFRREARILAQLDHPNIIRVLDFGMTAKQAYLSFEHFDSENLSVFLKKNNPTYQEKRELFIQLLKSLAAAHHGKVIHRDLKPENVLVNGKRQLKIADFGLAILQDDTKVTNKSSIVGTPAYMSPEQIRGEPLENSSDLFALGIIGFEMFYGFNPFVGKDINTTINKILSFDEQRLFENVDAPEPELTNVFRKLLRHSTVERGTAAKLLVTLGENPDIITPLPAKKNRVLWPLLFILLISVAVALVWIYSGKKNNKQMMSMPVADEARFDSVTATNSDLVLIKKIPPPTKPIDGVLGINVKPAADIFINDQQVGSSESVMSISLQPGVYDLRLIREGYPSFSQNVSVTEAESALITVNLDSLFGYFTCQVHPWGDVHINDLFVGQTPLLHSIKLIPGKYRIRIQNPNFALYQDSIDIHPGETTTIRVNLENKNGS